MMLEIPQDIFDAMMEHARAEAPLECCGFLAGTGENVTRLLRLRNERSSPVAYWANPDDLFAAHREMRGRGLDLLAIYHSHPITPAIPSRMDLVENYNGEIPQIIISLAYDVPEVKAYRFFEDRFEELSIVCKPN